ncbi:hypothetical protein AB0D13_32550 [Streptomyces sp. NPDC048430]|uniref:hypothetical protein n=1 Tax=Streptomyces sp. NPDC048430 TaxID=3155388 RepID=UPI0034481E72
MVPLRPEAEGGPHRLHCGLEIIDVFGDHSPEETGDRPLAAAGGESHRARGKPPAGYRGASAGFPRGSITGRQLVPAMLDELGTGPDMTKVRNELDVMKVETFY